MNLIEIMIKYPNKKNNEMNNDILVTGATGTVGSEVLKHLLNLDVKVKAAVRSPSNKIRDTPQIEFDYGKPDTLSNALKNVNKIFLVTPFDKFMVDNTEKLVIEAKKNDIQQIVKISVMGADVEPGIMPTQLHRMSEKIIEESQIPYTFLRPNSFMQNFVNFLGNSIKNNNVFYGSVDNAKMSFIDVNDIAAVAVHCLLYDENKGKSYTLTGSESLSYYDAAEYLTKVLGKQISYVDISDDEMAKNMKNAGMDDWTTNSLIELAKFTREGYLSGITDSVEKITGNKPKTFLEFVVENKSVF